MNRLASLSIVLLAGSVLSASALADTGVINLGPEEIIKAKGKEIVVPGYSVPSFEDWNNDGRKDLIVGEGGGGATGKIRVYLNVGTEADPCFADYFYAQEYGAWDLTCTPEGCLGCFPRLVNWDEDEKKDLLVGCGDGTVKVFLNIGSEDKPSFDVGTDLGAGPAFFLLDIGARATPSLVDWNNDGMTDLVAGGLDGAIHVYYNCGCGGFIPPRFTTSPPAGVFVQANGRDLIVPSGRSSPVIIDADGDGKKDIITGNTDGQILFYKNMGTDYLPMFAGYTMVQSNGKPIQLSGSLRSRPSVCYWTGSKDAHWDLLVGYGDGKIRLYRDSLTAGDVNRGLPTVGDFDGKGTLDAEDFTILVKALDMPVPVGGSPCDLNHDGVVNNLDLRIFADLWLAAYGADKK
ncbi:MAG: FG-GAP-like repeat-containing protein [Phycisphaerae bacterium]|nr:FG-GAP-like repeat-containing protein [Phycisphaerae bacterium]